MTPSITVAPRHASAAPFRIEYRRADALTDDELDALWDVFRTVARTSREVMAEGLRAMDEVFVVSQAGAVVGFGGVRVFRPAWQGRPHTLIFTGRVCLLPALRGRNVIQRVGFRYYLRERRAHPGRRVYWLFAASSYKSYLLMPRNFAEYWPRPDASPPARERALLASVADAMDQPSDGANPYADLVNVDGNVAIEPEALRDPDVAFYARINPGHVNGEFVLGLVPLTAMNWATALARVAARSARRALLASSTAIGAAPEASRAGAASQLAGPSVLAGVEPGAAVQ